MATRRFYKAGTSDQIELHPTPFIRYDLEHTVSDRIKVQPCTGGGWEVMAYVDGPMTYSGNLVCQALHPMTAKGKSLNFRTRRDAQAAARAMLPVAVAGK